MDIKTSDLQKLFSLIDERNFPIVELIEIIKNSDHQSIEEPLLPTEITIGNRIYKIINYFKENEDRVSGDVMVKRAKEMYADLGENEGRHILAHQDQIPIILRGKVMFIFPNWRHLYHSDRSYCIRWSGDKWIKDFFAYSDNDWSKSSRLLRRKRVGVSKI